MAEYTVWLDLLMVVTVAVGICCFFALFSTPIRQLFSSVFTLFYRPLSTAQEIVSGWIQGLRSWIAGQLADECERRGEGPVYYIIGSIVCSVLTVLFMICDLGVIVQSLEAMGFGTVGRHLPFEMTTLTAGALVLSAVLWGVLLFDLLGVTRLAPWRKSLPLVWRSIFLGLTISFLVLTAGIVMSLAVWRSNCLARDMVETEPVDMLADSLLLSGPTGAREVSELTVSFPETEKDHIDSTDPVCWPIHAALLGIALDSCIATAFSAVGLVMLLKFVIIACIGIVALPLLPVIWVAGLITMLLDGLFNVIERVADLLAGIGDAIMQPFGRRAGQEQGRAAQPEVSRNETDRSASGETVHSGFNPFGRKEGSA